MHEMIQTERDYVRSLEYIIEVSAGPRKKICVHCAPVGYR